MKFLWLHALFPPLFFSESKLGLMKNDVGMCLRYIFYAMVHCWFASKHAKGMSLRYDAMLLQWKNTVRFGEKPNPVGTWYFTSAHNCDTILNINHLTRTRSVVSLPSKIVLRNLMHFLPIIHVIIRAVFYVFVFDSIHDSATMHNLSPHIFYWTVFIHWTLVSLVGKWGQKKSLISLSGIA